MLVQGPHNFPFLTVSSAPRSFLGLLAVQSIVGLRPTGLRAQSLPSFETKIEPGVGDREVKLTRLKQSPGGTPHSARQRPVGSAQQQASVPPGGGGYQLQGGLISGWLLGYQGN